MVETETKKLYVHLDVIEKGNKKENKLEKSTFNKRNYYYEQLLIYGWRLPQVKSVAGKAKGWLRLPLGGGSNGKDKYLWFISGETKYGKTIPNLKKNDILIRSIRDHDDTKYDLKPGVKSKWKAIDLKELDDDKENYQALTDAQNQIVKSNANLAVVEGFPGTGKTIALLKKSDKYKNKKQIYLTHSLYLSAKTKTWFEAKQNIIKDREVYAFAEFVLEFAKVNKLSFNLSEKVHNNHLEAEANFNNIIRDYHLNHKSWNKSKDNNEIYHELYSKAFGLYNKNLETPKKTVFENYKKREQQLKKDALVPKIILKKIFEKKDESNLFPSLMAARELVDLFLKGELKIPQTLEKVEVVLVDEVQDLTEIECFLLLLYSKSLGENTKIIIAGDESQTVKPSAFKWRRFNTIIDSAKIQNSNKKNKSFNLEKSLRAPTQIAKIIHSTGNLYRNIDKSSRPSVKKYDSNVTERYGRVIYYSASNAEELNDILEAIAGLASAASIYPGVNIPGNLKNALSSEAHSSILTTERVKGLDYGTVAIIDSGKYLSEIYRHIESAKSNKRQLEALRTKIDRLRVAVSRPTDMLILLDISPTSANKKKEPVLKTIGYRYYIEKLFASTKETETDEMYSIISTKDQLLEELNQDTTKEDYIAREIDQLSQSIHDNPKSVQNETQSLLQITKKAFYEHEIDDSLYREALILSTVTFFNSIFLGDKYEEFKDFRRIIDKNLNELAKMNLFKETSSDELKIFTSKIIKFKTSLILKELDSEVVQGLNSILKSSKLLNNLKLSVTTKDDVLNPSFKSLIDTWFESLKEASTPDVKTISLIDATITQYIKIFIMNIEEKKRRKEKKEVFEEILRKIYKNWAEFSEKSANGTKKIEALEKSLDSYYKLSELSKTKENIESVVRLMRRLGKHSDAEEYLKRLSDEPNLSTFEELNETIYSIKEIVSSIEDFGKENIFLDEEIDLINEKLARKRSK